MISLVEGVTCVSIFGKSNKASAGDADFRITPKRILLAMGLMLSPGMAFAQSNTAVPQNNLILPGAITAEQIQDADQYFRFQESTAPAATRQGGLVAHTLTPLVRVGPLADFANNFAKKTGLSFNALYIGEGFTNPGEGNVPNQQGTGSELRPGVDIDLNTLFGWRGAQIHIAESFWFLQSNIGPAPAFPADAGGFFAANPPFAPKHRNYLTLLSLEQKLMNNRLDFEVGRINANHYIELPNCTVALTCGDPIEMLSGGGAPPQYAFWGGRARFDITPKWWVQTVAVENNPTDTNTDGFTFNTKAAVGAKFDLAVSRHATYIQEAYPKNYEVDLIFNSDRQTIPDEPSGRHKGTFSILSREQQVIWRSPDGILKDPNPENVTAFGTISADPDKTQPYNYFLQGGIWYGGFWRSHPLDRVGLMLSYIDVNSHEIRFQREQRALAGGPNVATPTSSYSFEVDSSIAITPNIIFQPYVQYDLNPDSFFNIHSPAVPKSGWVMAGTLFIYVGRALGLSVAPSP